MFYLTIIYNVARLLLIARLSDVAVSADEPLVGMCGNTGREVIVRQFFILKVWGVKEAFSYRLIQPCVASVASEASQA